MKLWSQALSYMRLFLQVAVTVMAASFMTLTPRLVPTVTADTPASNLHTVGATNVQFLGFSDALNKTSFGGLAVSEISGLTYDEHRGVYYGVADRAGSTQSHFFTLDLPVSSLSIGEPKILDVTGLKHADGSAYNGHTFDAEGIAVTAARELLIASEGGDGKEDAGVQQPEITRFSMDGAQLSALDVPSRFLIGTNNLSFESMALSPDGRSLFTANERALPAVGSSAADGLTSDNRNRIRILRYEDRGEGEFVPVQQFFYLTDPDRAPLDLGVVDMVALSETDLLIMERGFVTDEGNTVRVFRVSLEGATDVSNQPTLAALEDSAALAKTLVFDLADCPSSGATSPEFQPNPILDNFEAMALGPYLSEGRRVLMLVSDDNESSSQVMRFIALAIPEPGLVGQD